MKCNKCNSEKNLEIHHIIPVSRGGKRVKTNEVLLCRNCHKIIHGKKKDAIFRLVLIMNKEIVRRAKIKAYSQGKTLTYIIKQFLSNY